MNHSAKEMKSRHYEALRMVQGVCLWNKYCIIAVLVLILLFLIACLKGYGHLDTVLKNPTKSPVEKIGEAQKISIDDLLYMESIKQQETSPDGSSVAWIKSGYLPGMEVPSANIFLTSLDDLTTRQLTKLEGNSLAKVQWSPDGKAIAFMSNIPAGGGQALNQVWSLELQSGRLERLTSASEGVNDFAWGGAGTILYTAADGRPGRVSGNQDDTIRVTEHIDTPVCLFTMDLSSGRVERLTDNDDLIENLAVSPNGRYAFLGRTKSKSLYYQFPPVDYYIYDLENHQERQVFPGMRISVSAAWSPDSRTLFATELFAKDKYLFAAITTLRTLDISSGQEEKVDLDWKRGLLMSVMGSTTMMPIADGFLALLEGGCHPKLARYVKSGSGYERRMMKAEHQGNIFSLKVTSDGNTVCYEHSTASKPVQYYVASIKGDTLGKPRPYTKLNPQFQDKTFARAEAITWRGALGDTIEGMLYYPADFDPGRKYPLMLNLHGGPPDCTKDKWWAFAGWLFPYHIISQKGAFVLDPNYHGSAGYGLKFSRSIRNGKLYEYPIEDIEKGIERLVELGMVDERRLGTMGWSFGSNLSNALIAREPRFKVASCGAGGAEWISFWSQCYTGYSFAEYYLGGSPIEKPDLFKDARLCPFYDAKKVKTPIIMFIGERDEANLSASWTTYRGIQKYGRAPVELYVFPGEPHILQKLSHQRRKMVEEQNWFDKYFFDNKKGS